MQSISVLKVICPKCGKELAILLPAKRKSHVHIGCGGVVIL